MLRKRHYLICMLGIALGLSACATVTEQELLAAGATRMNGAQTTAHISGKTESWPYYRTYYSPDGNMAGLWDKVRAKGNWEVSSGGKVCVTAPKFGKSCHSYVDDHGAITRIENGNSVGVKEVVDGRRIQWGD
jgi:hypothetical protein